MGNINPRGFWELPLAGFVVDANDKRVLLSDSPLINRDELRTFLDRVPDLKRGDVVLYISEKDPKNNGQSHLKLERIIERDFPIGENLKNLISSTRMHIKAGISEMTVEMIKQEVEGVLGLPLTIVDEAEAKVIIQIAPEDVSGRICPIGLDIVLQPRQSPFRISVPKVSDKTIFYIHRICAPSISDPEIRRRLFAFRFAHMVLHGIGILEHMDFNDLMNRSNALRKEDPSIAPGPPPSCIMDWPGLHYFAATKEKSDGLNLLDELCGQCNKRVGGTNMLSRIMFDDFRMGRHQLTEEESAEDFMPTKAILYVLGKKNSPLILGSTPYVLSQETNLVSKGDSYEKTMNRLWGHKPLEFAPSTLDSEAFSGLKMGDKAIFEFQFGIKDWDDSELVRVRLAKVVGSKVPIRKQFGFLSRLGLRQSRVAIKIRIKWADVDRGIIEDACAKLHRLTGWKTSVDRDSSRDLAILSDRMDRIMNDLKQETDFTKLQILKNNLKAEYDKIAPKIGDVLDQPTVILHVLPKSSFGIVEGETIEKTFAWVRVPQYNSPVNLWSESCETCSKKYSKGRHYKDSDRLVIYMIHEMMHLTSDLPDHKGECRLCRYNDPTMLPLRFISCDSCIQHDGHFVHRNCIMSYACGDCMASRLAEFFNISEILCEDCRSKVVSSENILSNYFRTVNYAVYSQDFLDPKLKEILENIQDERRNYKT